jgi:hypothetical protein
LTPSSTAAVSGSVTVPGVTDPDQIEHGQAPGAAAVVNDQDTGAGSWLPAVSVAPLTVAV